MTPLIGFVRHYGIASLGTFLVGAGSLVVFTRLLGPTEYGVYVLVTGTVMTFTAIFGDWLIPALIRLSGDYAETDVHAFRRVVLVVAGVAAATSATITAIAVGLALSTRYAVIGVALCFAWIGLKLYLGHLRAMLRTQAFATVSLGVAGAALVLGAAAGVAWRSPAAVLTASLIPGSALTLWVVYEFLRGAPSGGHPDRRRIAHAVLSFGVPIAISSIGAQALVFQDRYLLAILADPISVGVYSANYGVAEKLTFLPFHVLFGAAYPVAVSLWTQGDRGGALAALEKVQHYYWLIGGLLAVSAGAFGTWLVDVLAGEQFVTAPAVPALIVAGNVAWVHTLLWTQSLELTKKTGTIALLTVGTALSNLVLNVVLIPPWGVVGAATATCASYMMGGLAARIITRKIPLRVKFPRRELIICLPLLLLAIALRVLIPNAALLTKAAVGASFSVIYFGWWYLVGEARDRELPRKTLRRGEQV